MHSSFSLIILILGLLLCSTIILLSAQDDMGDSYNRPSRQISEDDVPIRQDNKNAPTPTKNSAEGGENMHVDSNQHIVISAAEQLHDDSLTKLIPHDILLLLNETGNNLAAEEQVNQTTYNETADSNSMNRLDNAYHDEEPLTEPTLLNTSSIESDQGSTNVIQNENGPLNANVTLHQEKELNEKNRKQIIDLLDDDEADSQKARVFVDYASKHSGANIIDKSKDFQGTSNLLVDDDDRYAISPCDIGQGSTKYVIIALSEDILVKTIKISSYERYSSQTKQFQILGSQTYPISTKWVDLGTFTAKPWYNTNGQQTFELEQGVWARYLKFRFLTHYGNEHYCTVTQIMVHGQTTLQDFHEVRWDSVETFDNEESNEVDKDTRIDVYTNTTTETSTLSIVDDLVHGTSEIIIQDPNHGEEVDSVVAFPTQSLETNSKDHEVSDITSETMQNPAISLSIPSAKRSELDSLYSVDFYQNILQMSSNSFQSIYDTAANQCIDATVMLSTSTKSRAFETGFRTVANFTTRLEPSTTTPSLISTLPSNKSKVYDAVNSAVMSVVKISPISDAFKSIQRFLNVDITEDSMIPRKRITEPVLDDFIGTNTTILSEDDESFNQSFSVSDSTEIDKVNPVVDEPLYEKEQLSPIELQYENKERRMRIQVAECLGRLNIHELKVKVGKASKGSGSSSNVNEPIFKKLADEIKGLQTNQGVYDQFIKSATACYQSVFTEILNDMLQLESTLDSRLIEMEKNLLWRIDSHSDSNIWIDTLMSFLSSFKGFLHSHVFEFRCCFRIGDNNMKRKLRLWEENFLMFQRYMEYSLLSVSKAAPTLHFDVGSFVVGFMFAFCLMFLFTWRRKKRILG